MKFKLYLYFIKKIFAVNFSLSLLFAILSADLFTYMDIPLLGAFSYYFGSLGYVISVFIFHFFAKKTKYLYFNMGISLQSLYIWGFLFNLILTFCIYLIGNAVWGLKSYM